MKLAILSAILCLLSQRFFFKERIVDKGSFEKTSIRAGFSTTSLQFVFISIHVSMKFGLSLVDQSLRPIHLFVKPDMPCRMPWGRAFPKNLSPIFDEVMLRNLWVALPLEVFLTKN